MIKADLLSKANVFKNISFKISDGLLCILSKKPERSAALLAALSSLKITDAGTLSGNGSAVFISKGAPLPRALTAKEYLSFVSSVKKSVVPEKALRITDDFYENHIEALSAFERFSLNIAASLIGATGLIALEEPYFGIPYEEYGDLKELLRSVSEDIPVVFSSSSVFECKELSDYVLVMSGESQIFFGDTKSLFETEINETDICALIKGEKEEISSALESYSPEIAETSRQDVFSVTVKSIPMFKAAQTRAKIKKTLSKARLSLLEIKSDKEALLNIIGDLSENDRKKRIEYEDHKPEKVTKITKTLVAFNHNDDTDGDEYGEDETDTEDT